MPNIADLFVTLGVKGSEKTVEAFAKVKSGLGEIASTSLETKAAILGAVYALEQLTAGAAQRGAHLENLAAYLETDTKFLQQWSYAAQQGSISNEEFEGTLVSIQNKIKAYRANEALPKGSAIFAQETGFDFTKNFKLEDIFPKLLEFAKNTQYSKENIETILEAWGFTPNEIGAAFKDKFKEANVGAAPFISNKENSQLAKVNVEWENLETKVKMFIGHLTAKDGEEAVNNLSKMADSVFRIANDIERIATKLGIFKLIGESFEGWDTILDFVANKLEGNKNTQEKSLAAQEQLDNLQQNLENKKRRNNLENFFPSQLNDLKSNIYDNFKRLNVPVENYGFTDYSQGILKLFDRSITPPVPYNQNLGSQPQNININQNLNFQHPGTEIIPTVDSFKTAIVQASSMFSARSRST